MNKSFADFEQWAAGMVCGSAVINVCVGCPIDLQRNDAESHTEHRKAAVNRCVRCGLLEVWQDEDNGEAVDERRIPHSTNIPTYLYDIFLTGFMSFGCQFHLKNRTCVCWDSSDRLN